MSDHGERKIGLGTLAAYGCGDLYGGGSFLIISTLFLFFLTDVIGLRPALAGAVVFAGKAWDAVSDPLMGVLSDRTRSRFGRRRPYFLAGILPVFATFALLFVSVRTGSQALTFLYYFMAYVLFSSVSTMVMIPYAALPADMSGDYRVRTRLSGARMLFSQVSALLAGTIPGYLVKNLYQAEPAKGFLIVGLVFGALYALPWIVVFLGTWEPEVGAAAAPSQGLAASFRSMASLARLRSYRLHIGLYLAAYTAMDVLSAFFVYYVTYYLGRGALYTYCLGAMLLAQLAMLPAYLALANRFGKGRTYAIGAGLVTLVAASFLLVDRQTPTALLLALSAGLGLGLSAVVAMPWAMLPESADVDALVSGESRAGAISGTFTLSRKLVQAGVIWLLSVALSAIGYVPHAEQSAATLAGFRLLFSLLPLVCVALGALLALRYPVTPATFAVLREELGRRRGGGAEAEAGPEARQVCASLIGRPYGDGD